MKTLFVIRHAEKDLQTGELTDAGRAQAKKLQTTIGPFSITIAADRPRQVETALIVSGTKPEIDEKAGFVYETTEREKLKSVSGNHRLADAGALFQSTELEPLLGRVGDNLISLIKQTLERLPENEQGLIVSQDGVMAAAVKKLLGQPLGPLTESFKPLEGFIVDQDFNIKPFGRNNLEL